MMIVDVESVFLTTIIQSPLGNRIYSISLSLEQIPFILFILDDSSNPTVRPLDLTLFIDFSKRCQLLRNSIGSITFYISVKNIAYRFCLCFVHSNALILRMIIISKTSIKSHHLSPTHLHLNTHFHILR